MLASDISQDPRRADCAARVILILQLLLDAANHNRNRHRNLEIEDATQEECTSEPEIPPSVGYARDGDASKPVISLTLFDLFVLYRNDMKAHLVGNSPFNIVLKSRLLQMHLSRPFKEPFWRRILHTLLCNYAAFGKCCMLEFVRSLVATRVSVNVLISHRNHRGENIAFPFLAVLAMFSELELFRKVAAPLIADAKITPHYAPSEAAKHEQNQRCAIFLLGSALNAAIGMHNNAVVEFLCSVLTSISIQSQLGLALLCEAYQAPFNLIEFISEKDFRRAFETLEWCSSGLEVTADTGQTYIIDQIYSQQGLPCDYTIITPLAVACCVRNVPAIVRLTSEPQNRGIHRVCYLVEVPTNYYYTGNIIS